MRVEVISETKQVFDGVTYYRCGNYFQRKGVRLHLVVWKHYNGEIPKGYHVHHKDGNRANNQIENLELLIDAIHISQHAKSHVEYNLCHIEDMRVLAKEWHASEEGRAWHGEHAREMWAKQGEREYVCTQCRKKYMTRHIYGEHDNHFCSNACKTRHRALSGIDNETRTCKRCGKEFEANKYSKKAYCSTACARKKR